MAEKPGVMIYFEMREMLKRMSDKNAGLLFRAILEYGYTGKTPELPNSLYLLWPLVQMRLDGDDHRYRQISLKRRYAVYVRWTRHCGQEPISYEQWVATLANEPEEDSLDLS